MNWGGQMNIAVLRTFLAIVETRNLSRAAERLNVTQSTVTARLNGLEEDLGQTLLHRRKSGAELTASGFRFERYAQLMVDLWRQARQEASLPSHVDVVCNFGCHFDLWAQFGQSVFDDIRQSQSNASLAIWPGEQGDLDRWLGTGLIDAALCYAPTLAETWTAQTLREDRLVLVSTEQRRLMRSDPAYIYVDFGEEFRRSHAETYPDADTPMTLFGCAAWALDHLLTIGGSAYLPERLIESALTEGRLHRVPAAPEFVRRTYLVVNKSVLDSWTWLDPVLDRIQRST